MKLSPKALGLTCGLLWGIILCAVTLSTIYMGYLKQFADLMVGVYPYYAITWQGSIAGFIWGFIDGFIGGMVFAWIYNYFAPGSAD